MHRVDVQLEDDLTGGPADETILFSVDGRSYEIDLNSRHASEFRHRLVPFTEHARLARPQRQRVTVRSAASRERSRQIRLWAEERGFALSPHGRLPGTVIQEYEREHGADRQGEPSARRLPAQRRGGSPRQARKTSAGGRSPRQRAGRALRRPADRRPGAARHEDPAASSPPRALYERPPAGRHARARGLASLPLPHRRDWSPGTAS
jgi:Lsr2